jgi:mRNA interferase MazF
MKRFLEWIGLMERLDAIHGRPPHVSQADMWWASIGENLGSEIHGKSALFSRPVIIYKKLAHGFYFVIPTTSKAKDGSWYVKFQHKGKDMYACLHQARSIDYRRLSTKLGTLDDSDFSRIKEGFSALYK